ncbi:MAG: hypothetical protein ACOC8H_01615 [bacterium]
MRDLIERFLRHGRQYFSRTQEFGIYASDRTPDGARLVELQSKRCAERAELLRIGPGLAAKLEGRGADSRLLLKFLHAIDGGGGPAAAIGLWPDVKAELQRVLLKPKGSAPSPPAGKARRSTARGDTRVKIIAALTKHHRYAAGSLLKQEPASVVGLEGRAEVARSTVSRFFTAEFGSHAAYSRACGDKGKLIAALRMLNNEFAPSLLYGSDPDRTPEDD